MDQSSPPQPGLPGNSAAGMNHEQASSTLVSSVLAPGGNNETIDSADNSASPPANPIEAPECAPQESSQRHSRDEGLSATSGEMNGSTEVSRSKPTSPSTVGEQTNVVTKAISWWWWWEIGAAALSMLSMLLIIVVLVKINNRPLQTWRLPIQPNSLIAIFTTAGKTAMMVPAAACIAQLKWRHFHRRARRLNHLQLFDDASRGPWGSIMMIYGIRSQALLASAFAVITLVALGIEPSAQQILAFPQKLTTLNNVSAEIGKADFYNSKAFTPSSSDIMDPFSLLLVAVSDYSIVQLQLC
jgi:hypothetical protein